MQKRIMTMLPAKRRKMQYLPMDYTPLPTDILCGRGRSFCKHFGNQKFSEIVRNSVQRYRNGQDRSERREIVETILEHIFQQGYRFLKQDTKTQQFYELDSEAAHEKTGHAIRDLIKMMKNTGSPYYCATPSSWAINQPLVTTFDATSEQDVAKEIKLNEKLADLIDYLEKEQNNLSHLVAAASKSESGGHTLKGLEERDLVKMSLLPLPDTTTSRMQLLDPRTPFVPPRGCSTNRGNNPTDIFYPNERLAQIQLPNTPSQDFPGVQPDWTPMLPPLPGDTLDSMANIQSHHHLLPSLQATATKTTTTLSHATPTGTIGTTTSLYAALDQFDHDLDEIFDNTLN